MQFGSNVSKVVLKTLRMPAEDQVQLAGIKGYRTVTTSC